MLSRSRFQNTVENQLDFSVIPQNKQDEVRKLAIPFLEKDIKNQSNKIKLFLSSELYTILKSEPDVVLYSFLKCQKSLFSMIKNGNRNPENSITGRPTKMLSVNESKVRLWLENKIQNKEFPTKREFKECCVNYLEEQKFTGSFSKNYFSQLLQRIAPDYEYRNAQPLDYDRTFIKRSELVEYFELLEKIQISKFNPRLVINLDETGFGGSKSGRNKSKKVLVPKKFQGTPYYPANETVPLISTLIGVTASGEMLKPCSIIQRGSEHPDGFQCPYFKEMLIYITPKAFITRRVFENCYQKCVIEYVNKVRTEINKPEELALVLYDGMKGHVSDILFALSATQNIRVIMIPSHSSHLVQPLDQGIFKSMKSLYSTVNNWANVSKITTKLQKIYTAIQMSNNEQTILRSWAHSGILPIIEKGYVTSLQIVSARVLMSNALQDDEKISIKEKSRGNPTRKAESGMMNELHLKRVADGCCALCGTKLPVKDK